MMTADNFKAKLAGDPPIGCFLFCGEEAYLRRYYLDLLREKMCPDPAYETFNHLIHEEETIDFGALAAELQTPPFLSDYKLIEWHAADFSKPSNELLEELTEIVHLQTAEKTTTLVFVCSPENFDPGSEKKPSDAAEKLGGLLEIVRFDKSTDSQLTKWLKLHFDHDGISADPTVLRAILLRCGHSMDILASESNKLICYAKANKRSSLSTDDVALICAPTTEADAFGLTNALQNGKPEEAYRNLQDMHARRVDPLVILGQISRLYGDLLSVALLVADGMNDKAIENTLSMNRYKVGLYIRSVRNKRIETLRRALSLCVEADRAAKMTFGSNHYALLDKLVAQLILL